MLKYQIEYVIKSGKSKQSLDQTLGLAIGNDNNTNVVNPFSAAP